ncbi:glycosyltransferase family 71 protein, partial [Piromyces sp. E2]
RGIVICAGDGHFKYAISTIDTLRNIIETDIPVEIFYNGESDLSIENRKKFQEYKDVFVSDISKYFDEEPLNIGGWAIKPFSVLASRFQEVILMDADAMYIKDPSILFEDEGYINTGTVFFRDRTLFPGPHGGSEWLKTWMVDPLPETGANRFWNEESAHEMESSTVVIDKSRTILGLLATCKFNEQRIREDVVYQKVHGDKETFWMGFDMARQHYNIIPLPSVFIGELATGAAGDDPDAKQLCGHVGHLSRDGQVLFWNDHIVKDK